MTPTAAARQRRATVARVHWGEVGTLIVLMALLWWLWPGWVVYPLKILVVIFHELSHALAALATGGRVVSIGLVPREGGVCLTAGGNAFLVLTAGYLGSLVWGGALLLLARGRRQRAVVAALGAVLVAAALLWVRPVFGFGFPFTLLAGAALVAAGLYLPAEGAALLLKVVGLTSVLYAVLDIRDDILARPHLLESDAAQLARLTGLPTLLWGLLWFALALIAAAYFVAAACRTTSTPPSRR